MNFYYLDQIKIFPAPQGVPLRPLPVDTLYTCHNYYGFYYHWFILPDFIIHKKWKFFHLHWSFTYYTMRLMHDLCTSLRFLIALLNPLCTYWHIRHFSFWLLWKKCRVHEHVIQHLDTYLTQVLLICSAKGMRKECS